MAQPFSMRYPLVEGQGNFRVGGTVIRRPAMRLQPRARLAKISAAVLEDIDKENRRFSKPITTTHGN